MKLPNYGNYAIVHNSGELKRAMNDILCGHIIWERGGTIYLYVRHLNKWLREKYVLFGEDKQTDEEVTGRMAYQKFYSYCGKEEVERMKLILPKIDAWDSVEQLHYSNVFHSGEKIRKNIYEFDANSSFTYGIYGLPKGFEKLKEYTETLYQKKQEAVDAVTRSKYKNLQNFLVGYFARVSGFVSTRSNIIDISNNNIGDRMREVNDKKGTVYISNTDSIITDDYGADVMAKYMGSNAGQFKLKGTYDRLYYRSSNCYQLGNDVVWSGVKYFAKINTDFFEDRIAEQRGSLIEGYDFVVPEEGSKRVKKCRVRFGVIDVFIYNEIGELVGQKEYKIE